MPSAVYVFDINAGAGDEALHCRRKSDIDIDRHRAFRERKPLEWPQAFFRLPDCFISNRMHAAKNLLIDKKKIELEMLEVVRYLDD
jgi:hypothetical protein